jgi:drug/metabolite transporter (DMT)-like permease
MTSAASSNHSALGYLACAAAGCLWGTGFYFGKIALAELRVGHMVFYRFAFALLVLLPVGLRDARRNRVRFSASEWRLLLLAAFVGVPLQFLVQFAGLARTTVSHASLMVGALPVILALGAVLFAGEHMPRIGWIALIASTLGAALIAFSGNHLHAANAGDPSLTGDLMILAAMVAALFWILACKRLMQRYSPIAVSVYCLTVGSLMVAVWVFVVDGPPPLLMSHRAWIALAISGMLCTACTTLMWNWGLGKIPASQAGVFLNLEPLIGSILGVTLLNEHLGPSAWIGGALIIGAAVTLTTRAQTQPQIIEQLG